MESTDNRSQRPKSRQSIAHLPSSTDTSLVDKQNTTVDLSALSRKQNSQLLVSKKKSRGKSLGPGGLEALKQTSGNAIKVCADMYSNSCSILTLPDCCQFTSQIDPQANSAIDAAKNHSFI